MIRYLRKANPKMLQGIALLRLDCNTEDDWRLEASLPTIQFLLRYASSVIIISHRGRPKLATLNNDGKILKFEKKLSLRADAKKLGKLLHRRVRFVTNFNFKDIKRNILSAPGKSVFFLENIRFLKGESTKAPELAKTLASLGDYYVNEAFAVSHRDNDSVAKIEKFLPSYAGLEFEKEIENMGRIFEKPEHPLILVLGGGKASEKLGVIKNFKNKVDLFLLGGAVANTILFLKGMDVKNSLRDRDKKDLEKIRTILKYPHLCLPVDFKWSKGAILDIGDKSTKVFQEKIKNARMVFWNGPMGLIEKRAYEKGTLDVAKAILKTRKAFTLAGGGETVMFLKKHKLDKKFSFISTGGGAMLDFLAGKKLPGIEALKHSPFFVKTSAGKKRYVK